MLAEVKKIREDNTALTDIPGMLRSLADLFEKGEYKETTKVLVIRDGDGNEPAVHGYGDIGRPEDALALTARAQASIIRMLNNGGGSR